MRKARWVLAGLLLFGAAHALAEETTGNIVPDPIGEWRVSKGYATIRIADCDGRLWGVVASETHPSVDSKNPDPNLRTRPTLGMPVLLSMARAKRNRWDGQIYNSQDGHTYSANISMVNPNTLKVEGCFLGFLCGGENWTRTEPNEATNGTAARNVPQAQPRGQQAAANSPPSPSEQVCLDVFGPTWLSHQRGLK
jgi:uncharacterized protein (DUF2147 family)